MDVTLYFFNPNITDRGEYEKRRDGVVKLAEIMKVAWWEGDYDSERFCGAVLTKAGMETLGEGGERCRNCYRYRLSETGRAAAAFDFFATTLTHSPHKDAAVINQIGREIAGLRSNETKKKLPQYLDSDWKKNDGIKRALAFAKEYNLYRQKYCGCEWSKSK
jgi:predicted adenine nucleotide alpha hydrolase (AANH) superfamily ATPase